jgi:hypothetical protein
MALKYTNLFYFQALKKLPKLLFVWFENIPSGKPGMYIGMEKADFGFKTESIT